MMIQPVGAQIDDTIAGLIEHHISWATSADAVFLKPNLTYPHFKPGVTTTPMVIESVIRVLKSFGVDRIFVGEGVGGYNSFDMEATLASMGAGEWARRYGVKSGVVNSWPSRVFTVSNRHGEFFAPFPVALWDEFDGLITLPVPKVHSMTTISGAIKNQWGLIQDPMRLRLHVGFNEILFALHQSLPSVGAVVDGIYGLTGNGPMVEGEPLPLGWIGAGRDLWEVDETLAGIMGFGAEEIPYLRFARRQGVRPVVSSELVASFREPAFRLDRNIWNRLAKATWYSRRLNYFVYFSRSSNLLHRVMYSFREAPEKLAIRGRDWM